MREELIAIAIKFKVSYDWSGQTGLVAIVIGAVRHAIDNPGLAAYVRPARPPNSPTYPAGNPTSIVIRNLVDANNQAKHDYAIVRGFVDGVSQLIQDAVELTYIKPLSHVRYGFNDVWPEQYLDHLLNVWCPLDAAAAREVKAHYERGWDRANGELLATFAERLDQEQASLQQDGVTIHPDDKYTHYITEIYGSGEFSETIIIEWTQQPDQNYATARAFF